MKETLDKLLNEIISDRLLPERIMDAVTVKNYQNNQINRSIYNRFLLQASSSLGPKLENMELRNDTFLKLLNMFVKEGWYNAQTYNSFIKGFGEGFDDFNDTQATKFISLLVQAGLNQTDILEAVIDKVLSNEKRNTSTSNKINLILDLVDASLGADAASNPAFEKLVDPANLDEYLKGNSQEILSLYMGRAQLGQNIKLLNSIISRIDLTQDSHIKSLVSAISYQKNALIFNTLFVYVGNYFAR